MILDDILKCIPSHETTIQVRELCNKIWQEEKDKIKYPSVVPDGANIFLAIEVPCKNKGEISFLTLERDPIDKYISNYYSIKIKDIQENNPFQMPKKYNSHKLEGRSAKKILIEFAKLITFYRGV